MLFTVLDMIADTVNPILGLLALVQLLILLVKKQWRNSGIYIATILALTVLIYGFMSVDRRLFDFPYSTHSAFAICFCTLHAIHMPRFKFIWIGILVSYLSLILFQGYHSVLDIAITLILVGPLTFTILVFSKPLKAPASAAENG